MRHVPNLFGMAVLVLVLTSCLGQDQTKRSVHDDGEGPLSASTAPGSVALPAPKGVTSWNGTFGSLLLCREKGTGTIDLEKVRVSSPVAPKSIKYFIRKVPANDGSQVPLIAVFGSPPDFKEPYANPRADPEDFRVGVKGRHIDERCGSADTRTGFVELLVSTSSDTAGSHVATEYIDYRFRGGRYTLKVKLDMVQCGRTPSLRTYCTA